MLLLLETSPEELVEEEHELTLTVELLLLKWFLLDVRSLIISLGIFK